MEGADNSYPAFSFKRRAKAAPVHIPLSAITFLNIQTSMVITFRLKDRLMRLSVRHNDAPGPHLQHRGNQL